MTNTLRVLDPDERAHINSIYREKVWERDSEPMVWISTVLDTFEREAAG